LKAVVESVPNSRTLVVSHRFVKPHVSWASGYEFEDVICEIDGADLIAPRALHPTRLPGEAAAVRKLRSWFGFDVQRVPVAEAVEVNRDYELMFVQVMTPADLRILDSIHGWKERCDVKVCWVWELWVDKLRHARMLELLDEFDYVFVGHVPTPGPLSELIKPSCHYLSFGVDALRFSPYPNPPERSIDFYALGRRSPVIHHELYGHASSRPGFNYFYDSARWMDFVEDHVQHRQLTANLIKRTKYFMADRAKANMPDQTKGSQVFGPRFFEGAAAGAVLIGEPPDCDTFRAYFDWPDAVIPFPFGSTGIVRAIEALEAEPDRVAHAREANVLNMLQRHDWSHRWAEVLDVLGLAPAQRGGARASSLEHRLRQVRGYGQRCSA
jgi:hypothetical protein